MQIGGVNSFISQLSSLLQKKTNNDSSYTPPSGEVLINSILEKLSIDKKSDMKQQEVERNLTGFGKEADEYVKRMSQSSAEIYRATLENELKNKIKELTQKEQLNKVAIYQNTANYSSGYNSTGLSLYS
ncbi:MAG TPA: hypothetical protein PKW30_07350 [Campylobacterales bacterium]|nr:hypothetical protein [Campylobacterales bacterium]